jgi:hypothetical protein
MIHEQPHPKARTTVTLPAGVLADAPTEYCIEDWWDRVSGSSWQHAVGNPAALVYALRSSAKGLPLDDEVVYGKAGPFGHLVHVSELADGETTS